MIVKCFICNKQLRPPGFIYSIIQWYASPMNELQISTDKFSGLFAVCTADYEDALKHPDVTTALITSKLQGFKKEGYLTDFEF